MDNRTFSVETIYHQMGESEFFGGLTLAEAQVALEERGVVVPGTNYIGYRTAWHRSGKIVKVEPSSGNSKNTTEVSK